MIFKKKPTFFRLALSIVLSTVILLENKAVLATTNSFLLGVLEAPKNRVFLGSEEHILFDAAGRIISQQFTDSSMELKFGNVNTQTFSYDQKTGALLEFKIANGDFEASFDGKGNRKSFELSAQMKAFIEEEQKKAVEAAKARARKQAAAKKKVQDNRKLISRTEVIEKGGKGKPSLTTKLTDSAIQALFKNDKVVKKLVEKYGKAKTAAMLQAAYKGKAVLAVGADAIREKVSGKLLTAIAQSIKARAPNAKSASEIIAANTIRRITEIYEVTDAKGNIHRVTEIKRIDGNGNQIERQVIDRFTFRNEQGKKVKAQIVSIYNSDDHLIKVGESYKQKMKKGTAVTKRTTVYNPETGDIISQKTKQKFEKSGFFNSTAGKILGAIIVVAAIVFAPYLMPFLSPLMAAAVGAGIATFGVSLAQGNSFKDALISGAIAFATTIIAVKIGSFFQGFGSSGGLLSEFGKNLSQLANPALVKTGEAAFTKFLQTAAIRATGTLIAEKFGSKLGAFGTAAVLTASAMLIGGFADAGGDIFNFDSLVNIGLQSAAQGGLAEAFKNENGLAAQALFQLSSTAVGAVDFRPVAQQFSNFVEGAGKVVNDLNPFTEKGLRNTATLAGAEKTGLKKPDIIRTNDEGEIKSLEYNVDTFEGKSGKVIASDPVFGQGADGEAAVFMSLEYHPNKPPVEPAPVEPTPTFWQRFGTGALDIGEGIFKGDFINHPTGLNTIGQIIGGLNPLGDGRDIWANINKMFNTGFADGKLGFTFALIGAIPLAGDAIKTVFKSTRAVDAAVNAGKVLGPEKQLEFDFINEINPRPRPFYPTNDGFLQNGRVTMIPGGRVDRFGSETGRFVAPEGTPYTNRSLPQGSQKLPYNIYEVRRPIEAEGGPAASAFGEEGLGIQYKFDKSIEQLIREGSLKRVGPD